MKPPPKATQPLSRYCACTIQAVRLGAIKTPTSPQATTPSPTSFLRTRDKTFSSERTHVIRLGTSLPRRLRASFGRSCVSSSSEIRRLTSGFGRSRSNAVFSGFQGSRGLCTPRSRQRRCQDRRLFKRRK